MEHLTHVLFLYLIYVSVPVVSSRQVSVEQGILEGNTVEASEGFLYDVFYSVPYAAPPVGKLRFRDPQPTERWDGIRNAKLLGPKCFHINVHENGKHSGEPDCLYLNVFTPAKISNNSNLPVMFWVHGGLFGQGTTHKYNPKHLVEKDVIVVIPNYRLGFIGFMALNHPEVSGNGGLKDLLMALKWTRQNVRNFGGDPDNVTVFGASSGAALVHYLVLSPKTTGLIHKAILQSGSSINEMSLLKNKESFIEDMINILGIRTRNSTELIVILNELPLDLIGNAVYKMFKKSSKKFNMFKPVVESRSSRDPFITESPLQIMLTGNYKSIPILTGYMSQEGLTYIRNAYDFLAKVGSAKHIDEVVSDFEPYVPDVLLNRVNSNRKNLIKESIKKFYFPTNNNILDGFMNLFGDYYCVKDFDKTIRLSLQHQQNVYCYYFSYHGSMNLYIYKLNVTYTGASHGDELGYIFDFYSYSPDIHIQPSQQDFLIRRRMVALWTNFAKFGNPTPTTTLDVNVTWTPATRNEMNCLNIDADLGMVKDPLQERMQFWRDLENGDF